MYPQLQRAILSDDRAEYVRMEGTHMQKVVRFACDKHMLRYAARIESVASSIFDGLIDVPV